MPQIELTSAERREYHCPGPPPQSRRARWRRWPDPGVRKEIDAALNAHGLIKIRVFSDDRSARELMYQELAAELSAAPIQHIGKLLVLWRPQPKNQNTGRRPHARPTRRESAQNTASVAASAPKLNGCALWATSA